ncbi:MAG: hypothetical protein U0N27_07235 [Massilistercora timonensis]
MYSRRYCIAGLTLQLESDEKISSDSEFTPFETVEDPDYIVRFRKVKELPPVYGEFTVSRMGVEVYTDAPYSIYRFLDIAQRSYAVSRREVGDKIITVEYLENGAENICHSGGAFFHIGWEDILLTNRRLIFHACCVASRLGGILFSGRSGIGKSTQGKLWCNCEGARIINEDRPILYKEGGCWSAYGSPYAGSSKWHVNERTEIRTIVMLEQAGSCSIRRLDKAEAFRRIYAQTTLENWNAKSVGHVCDLVEELVSEVPVYELACTPDRKAVDILKNMLTKG